MEFQVKLDFSTNMAEVAKPSTDKMATPSNATKDKSAQTARPERPDEEQYKSDLAKAEKELKTSEERMVRSTILAWELCRPNRMMVVTRVC